MKVELRETFESGLPPGDDHPYRSGLWRPQYSEYDAWDLDVEGEIPDDLAGVYLRNTETAVFALPTAKPNTPIASSVPRVSSPNKKPNRACGRGLPSTHRMLSSIMVGVRAP